ncbi:RNA polymerase sigma factor [Clostridium swellfunianum]|uniref:RNA polymerase sigma factor n=1 Tax=Clostridium swellfunianum TaxID=1367462 RepID=UPI0020304135|nr:RNA polymerase sigma factor [Clostridium swellfunianum]MCM0647697.1 RNA polymerase sigma factor [Clostridium swellfunianum]
MHKDSLEKQLADYVVRNKERYYRLAYSYVKNAEDALDIIQESIYKAISHIDSLKGIEHIKTWFYKIVVNTSLDFLRKQRRVVVVEDEVLASLDTGTNDEYENFDLQSALENLPEGHRTIVILRYFEDLKIEEIAEILDENISTIKTRLYKSLRLLRIDMNDYEEA